LFGEAAGESLRDLAAASCYLVGHLRRTIYGGDAVLSGITFRSRRPQRDLNTDQLRQARLLELVNKIGKEIALERTGLRERYQRDTTDAAFLLQSTENDDGPKNASTREEALSSDILSTERRLALLERQLTVMEQLQNLATQLVRT
jgi:hypothetical protein